MNTSQFVAMHRCAREKREKGVRSFRCCCVSLERRSTIADELCVFESLDRIPKDWGEFLVQCYDFSTLRNLHFLSNDECSMVFVDPERDLIDFSVKRSFN